MPSNCMFCIFSILLQQPYIILLINEADATESIENAMFVISGGVTVFEPNLFSLAWQTRQREWQSLVGPCESLLSN